MTILETTIGPRTVRMTKQSETARYGAGCYLVRVLKHGKKIWESSYTAAHVRDATESFHFEVRACKVMFRFENYDAFDPSI